MTIQWFPGHMAKTRNQLKEHLKFVDVIVEIGDARIPVSSRNPDFEQIFSQKPRLLLLNKRDLADEAETEKWLTYFNSFERLKALAINSLTRQGFDQIIPSVQKMAAAKIDQYREKGYRHRSIRVMIVGVPNVGKSSFINRFVGKPIAKIGDKPGITRTPQWIRIHKDIELLDTPGLLWPKISDHEVGIKLAATGAVKEEIIPLEEVATWIVRWFLSNKPDALKERYKLSELASDPYDVVRQIGIRRGFLQAGGKVDELKTASLILDELQKGKIARITLDQIPQG